MLSTLITILYIEKLGLESCFKLQNNSYVKVERFDLSRLTLKLKVYIYIYCCLATQNSGIYPRSSDNKLNIRHAASLTFFTTKNEKNSKITNLIFFSASQGVYYIQSIGI